MSGGTKGGFLHFLQRLFRFGGNKQPAQPTKKNRPSHAPKRKPPDTPAKKESPSRHKPAKKVAAKPKPATKPKAPPPAAPAEAPGEAPPPNSLPPPARRRVPRRRPRLPFTPLPRPRSLRGRLSQVRNRHSRLLDLQRVQARRRPRACLRRSAKRESQAAKRRLGPGFLPPDVPRYSTGLP